MVRMAPTREICARCGKTISSRQTPSVWRDNVVCAACHSKLRAIEPAAALTPAAMPVLRYAPKPPRNLPAFDPRVLLERCISLFSHKLSKPH